MTAPAAELWLPGVLASRELVVVDVEGNGRQPPEIIEIALLPLTTTRHTTPTTWRPGWCGPHSRSRRS